MKYIVSIGIWLGMALATVALCAVVLFFFIVLYPFDKNKKFLHRQCFWWEKFLVRMNPFWKLEIEGLENINPQQTYVIVANHQSVADIVLLYETRMQFKWVAKESLFKIPFIGWCLSLTRHIKLLRGEFGSIKKVYRQAAEWLRKDMSVLFFPEGTRSSTDKMNEFQNGAFKLAIKERRPVLPICIRGTREAIPKGGWVFKSHVAAKLTVLPAVETKDLPPGEFRALRDVIFSKIEIESGHF